MSQFDPDNNVAKGSGMLQKPADTGNGVVMQGGNVSSRLPGRQVVTGRPAAAVQGGVQSVSADSLKGRVEAATKEKLNDQNDDQWGQTVTRDPVTGKVTQVIQ